MAKQFIKRTLIAVCMTVFLVVIASLTYAYIVPALLTADIPGMITSGIDNVEQETSGIKTVFANATDQLDKVHKNNIDQAKSIPPDTPVTKTKSPDTSSQIPKQSFSDHPNYSAAKSGVVTKIVDGDTLDIDGIRIRLALVNTPERDESGYAKATAFTQKHCPVGSTALYDADDGQKQGSHGRVIGKVWCMGYPIQTPDSSLNSLLIQNGHAEIFTQFCNLSEFGNEAWAKQSGC